jgi:molybdopterin molybdotransferase
MDGFAVATPADGGRWHVQGELAAGDAPPAAPLRTGQAVRVMTGAPVPKGAVGVIMVEHASVQDGVLHADPPSPGQHIRVQGEVATRGAVVLAPGQRLSAERIGVAAAFGAREVEVHAAPRVRVHATGDELVGIEESPGPGQIRDSNRWSVAAAAADAGARVSLGHIVPDTERSVAEALEAAHDVDVLVLSGGVSMGAYDWVPRVLADLGAELAFHKVAMRPGKPLIVSRLGRTLVFGLPGNPVSAVVSARVFLTPVLLRLAGDRDPCPPRLLLPTATRLPPVGDRALFLPATLRARGGALEVQPHPTKGSADAVHHSVGEALIVRDIAEPEAPVGGLVRVLAYRSSALRECAEVPA